MKSSEAQTPAESNIVNDKPTAAEPPKSIRRRFRKKAIMPVWGIYSPFFLPAIMFLSGIFVVFAPLPILLVRMQKGRSLALLAAATNLALILYLSAPLSAVLFSVFVLSLSLSLGEFMKKGFSLEGSIGGTLLSMTAVTAGALLTYAHLAHVSPAAWFGSQINQGVDLFVNSLSNEARSNLFSDIDPADWKHSFIIEIPSAIAIFSLGVAWLNSLILVRMNPSRIREKMGLSSSYFRLWKSPEWLVWPTIFSGIFLLWDVGQFSEVAVNCFKFLMAIYAIHGLSVLSFFLDTWKIKGIFRTLAFLISVFVMMPFVLSLGFFDLWFDFRAKLRQS